MSDTARWVVLGAGGISGDFLRALPHARLGALHAVGARDAARARAFVDEFGGAVAGTYEEILGRDDVDAVYIGTVHTSHRELALAALAAGKAVLCEKPLGISVAETEEILAAADAAGCPDSPCSVSWPRATGSAPRATGRPRSSCASRT